MIIVDPVALGDVAGTRASTGTYFDRKGMLQTAPANTLRVTYDPSDLSKAPYALVEAGATNMLLQTEGVAYWNSTVATVVPGAYFGRDGVWITRNGALYGDSPNKSGDLQGNTSGGSFTATVCVDTTAFVGSSRQVLIAILVYENGDYSYANATFSIDTGAVVGTDSRRSGALVSASARKVAATAWELLVTGSFNATLQGIRMDVTPGIDGEAMTVGLMQLERGSRRTSYTPNPTNAAVTRAADVIAPGAGLVYSNDPIDVPTYDAGTTYAKDALAYDPVAHNVFQSIVANNVGKALTDTTAWTPRGAINRWAMFDQYNNTQSTNPDEILVVLSPQAISQGLYLGNLYADEVRISVVDQVEGVVYSQTRSLVASTSGSSFFNWAFKRIKRQDYFLTLGLPVYANALITISIRKIGGIARCGMCAVGPVDEFGPTLLGLSTEGKDYSSTTFNFDGTSNTIIRPYAKVMSCDVFVDNDQIDYVQARLFAIRQRLIIYVGGQYGSTAVAGRYSSFKNVIQYTKKSLMSLTIEGAV